MAQDLVLPNASLLDLSIRVDHAPGEGQIFVLPADEPTKENVRGRLNGRFKECAPLLGSPYGSSPACNVVLVSSRAPATVQIPPGEYWLYASAGPFSSIARQKASLLPGDHQLVGFSLQRLPVVPPGTLSADLHVHSGKSNDTTFPPRDRVLSILAADLQVVVATEHDRTYDYADVIAEIGADKRLKVIPGVETTGYILFLDVPGELLPKVTGHLNYWPMRYDPFMSRGGAPWSQLAEPGELFERMLPRFSGTPVVQLNHPWDGALSGRDTAFPRALAMNLKDPLPSADDGSAPSIFVRIPNCGPSKASNCQKVSTRNDAYNVQEVMNGTKNSNFLAHRAFWFYLLNQGVVRTGTANSDSHSLAGDLVGSPRNLVFTSTTVDNFDPEIFDLDVISGKLIGTNGPVIEIATLDESGNRQIPSTLTFVPGKESRLEIRVIAAPWVPVEEIRVYVNGQLQKAIREGIAQPGDPFGLDGLLRYQGEVPLSELLPPGSQDAYLLVEAGAALPLVADLNNDGVPDTGDNNQDGLVDKNDVKEDERNNCYSCVTEPEHDGCGNRRHGSDASSCGPLKTSEEPKEEDPLFHFNAVTPGSYPLAFTNPFFFDRDGDGTFSGPGLGNGGHHE